MHGSATRQIVLNVAETNFDYLSNMILELEETNSEQLDIQLKLTYNNVSVELTLAESLLVINALATKKIAIRGGAWSSIGKKVEKPLMLTLCKLCEVPEEYIDDEIFRKDGTLDFDREVDFKLGKKTEMQYRCEVKLMGKGNPESADAVFARNSDIFVADTLSEQNRNQLDNANIQWLELRNKTQQEILQRFVEILDNFNIPHKKI